MYFEPDAHFQWWCASIASLDFERQAHNNVPNRKKVSVSLLFPSLKTSVTLMRWRYIEPLCAARNTIKIINGWGNAIKESACSEHWACWRTVRKRKKRNCNVWWKNMQEDHFPKHKNEMSSIKIIIIIKGIISYRLAGAHKFSILITLSLY